MSTTKPNVLTIIINYNQWELTTACLASLSNVESIQNTVIVIDNGSTNNSVNQLLQWNYGPLPSSLTISNQLLPFIKSRPKHRLQSIDHTGQKTLPIGSYLIESKQNLGFSGGNNLAFDYINPSTFNYIWFLNNDTIVAPTAILEKIKHFESNASLGIVAPILYQMNHPNKIQMIGGKINHWLGSSQTVTHLNHTIDYLCGASLLLNQKCFTKIGLWDTDFFFCYEDADLSYRAKANGFNIAVCKSATVYHKESATLKKEIAKGNLFVELCRIKSRIIFAKKYQLPGIGIIIGLLVSIWLRIMRRQYAIAIAILNLIINYNQPIHYFTNIKRNSHNES